MKFDLMYGKAPCTKESDVRARCDVEDAHLFGRATCARIDYVILSKRSTERQNEELKWLELSLVGVGLTMSEVKSKHRFDPCRYTSWLRV